MITDDLYDFALRNPAKNNQSLYIVSGYSSATFTRRHLNDLDTLKTGIDVNLIIGMPSKRSDHQGYLALKQQYKNLLNVSYVNSSPPVHVKAYAWLGSNPEGFSGSANYSQPGFFKKTQVNQLLQTDPIAIKSFYDSLLARTIPIEKFTPSATSNIINIPQPAGSVPAGGIEWLIPDVAVRISFLARDGTLPIASGLNWGHSTASKNKDKPNQPRNRNDAYLSIRADAKREGFLPDKGFTFTTIADDGYLMDCVVAQADRKGVQTTDDNSILGAYIRSRIGVKTGAFVTIDDLIRYGRTDFTLIKLDDETFRFDISV